jgi:hypothetical protein
MRGLASAREPTFNNNDTAEMKKKAPSKYERPEAIRSFVVLMKTKGKNEYTNTDFSERRIQGEG